MGVGLFSEATSNRTKRNGLKLCPETGDGVELGWILGKKSLLKGCEVLEQAAKGNVRVTIPGHIYLKDV